MGTTELILLQDEIFRGANNWTLERPEKEFKSERISTSSCGFCDAKKSVRKDKDTNRDTIDIRNDKQSDKIPTRKERWAYAVEFSAKIIYPLAFMIYNIVYWTSHYGI